MANRFLEQFAFFFEKFVVTIFARVAIGAAGAVSGSAIGGGISSIAKQATAGQYLVTLSDKYYKLLHARGTVINATISGVASVQILQDPATLQSGFSTTPAFLIQCVDYAGAAVNPPSGSQIYLEIKVRNSSIGKFNF